jgi:hypothetical protein
MWDPLQSGQHALLQGPQSSHLSGALSAGAAGVNKSSHFKNPGGCRGADVLQQQHQWTCTALRKCRAAV